jgi:hypothetical protein
LVDVAKVMGVTLHNEILYANLIVISLSSLAVLMIWKLAVQTLLKREHVGKQSFRRWAVTGWRLLFATTVGAFLIVGALVPGVPVAYFWLPYKWIFIAILLGLGAVPVAYKAQNHFKKNKDLLRTVLLYGPLLAFVVVAYLWILPVYFQGWAYTLQGDIPHSELVDEQGRRVDAFLRMATVARAGWWLFGVILVGMLVIYFNRRWSIVYFKRRGRKRRVRGVAVSFLLVFLFTLLTVIIGAISVWDAFGAFWREMWGLPWKEISEFSITDMFDPSAWDLSNVQLPSLEEWAQFEAPWEDWVAPEVGPPTEFEPEGVPPVELPDWWPVATVRPQVLK